MTLVIDNLNPGKLPVGSEIIPPGTSHLDTGCGSARGQPTDRYDAGSRPIRMQAS